MRGHYESGRYKPVWEHRLELGYEFVQGDMPATTWFWLNAYPALAGLRGGAKGRPFLSVCAGYADQVHRDGGQAERDANAEIARLFFG